MMIALLLSLAFACNHSPESVLAQERRILSATSPKEIAEPLTCLLEIHDKAEGQARYLAATSLRALLGGKQAEGMMKDPRHKNIEKFVTKLSLKSSELLKAYAKGDWQFYKLFCEEGNVDFCVDFLPDEESVKKDTPLFAATSMLRLKNAYTVLGGTQKEKVAKRLKRLYKEIPASDQLQRKYIDEIYQELFGQPLNELS